jgi:sugar phosphate isomerase/epimerase
MSSCIAAQLYTLRDFTQTPADIATTMKKVREIGYEAVQLSALGPIDPKELKAICDGEGLTVCATHISYEKMRDETQAVIDEHRLLGCEYPAIGGMPGEYRSAEGFHRFAKDASEVARKLRAGGMTFGYHNHSFELEKFPSHVGAPRCGLDILRTESDPEVFTLEIDTYWIQHGGGSPVAWIEKCRGRIPLVHFKDMGIVDGQQVMAEIGEGNLDWPAIIETCKQSGTKWYIVEQDVCRRDPFESLKISLENLKAMGLE